MLEIKNLSAGYPGKTVLSNVSFTIPPGKITAILGPNGCGKSTLLKAICGVIQADSGEVLLNGEDILSISPRQAAQKVAYLAQSRQIPNISVQRLVLHGRFPYLNYPRRYRKEDYCIAQTAIERMGIEGISEELLQNLSGGQRQKVYIAMALAQDTPVIMLDEPTTYLDIGHQLQMMSLAKRLSNEGKTVLMIIHDLPHAFQTADNIILMENGTIAAEGSPEEVFASGKIADVFRVSLGRVRSPSGWRYYCEEERV